MNEPIGIYISDSEVGRLPISSFSCKPDEPSKQPQQREGETHPHYRPDLLYFFLILFSFLIVGS